MPSHRPYHPITYPNWDTENVSFTFDHEGENTLVVAGTTVVEAVGYNEMGQLKRLALGNNLTTWLGYHGYEAEHYNISMQMAERRLLPAIRAAKPGTLVVATGTSCRHQVEHGVGKRPLHPPEGLRNALI
jgi:hypothetical protein